MLPTRLDTSTPPSVRQQINVLIEAIETQCVLLDATPIGSDEEDRICACIDVLYNDASGLLAEWERDIVTEPRPASNCGSLCSEFQGPNGCDGSWYCSDARREELRRASS